jgi:hypothetical protein
MKKLAILFGLLLSFNVFSDVKDGVAVLNDEPTEKQMQVVRDGAKDRPLTLIMLLMQHLLLMF